MAETKEKTKITALHWHELTSLEQQLVIRKHIVFPNKDIEELKKAFITLVSHSKVYYFDRLGNYYVKE